MTGHGQALVENQQIQALTEVRTVNNRFLKLNINGDLNPSQMSELETLVKRHVARGSVNLKLETKQLATSNANRIDEEVLNGYAEQLRAMAPGETIDLASLLVLPGIIGSSGNQESNAEHWDVVLQSVSGALENLTEMRRREGSEMASDLAGNCDIIETNLGEIEKLAPRVIDGYSKKITDRINGMLEQLGASITPAEVVREVGIFAERVDISEETVRLASHIKQFRRILTEKASSGKKLDFLTQEMLRETNTIGSKANDAGIAAHVVEIKTVIERIREMVQNVE